MEKKDAADFVSTVIILANILELAGETMLKQPKEVNNEEDEDINMKRTHAINFVQLNKLL